MRCGPSRPPRSRSGRPRRSCPRAGQCSRPNWMIWRCRRPHAERREQLLEIALGLLDGAAAREAPARRQAVDVRVDREGRMAEGLRHHDARGLVADARQRLERLEIVRARARRAARPGSARGRRSPSPWPARGRKDGSRAGSPPPESLRIASGVAARANRRGVIWFTLTSVHCAESSTATSSV